MYKKYNRSQRKLAKVKVKGWINPGCNAEEKKELATWAHETFGKSYNHYFWYWGINRLRSLKYSHIS